MLLNFGFNIVFNKSITKASEDKTRFTTQKKKKETQFRGDKTVAVSMLISLAAAVVNYPGITAASCL